MALSRLEYVAKSAGIFAEFAGDAITVEDLEAFANNAEKEAHKKSREMTASLRGDEYALTNHASHVRTVAAKIVLLRDGLVPALKIDRNNPALKNQALMAMGWIRAEFEAMTCLMR